MPAAPYQIDGTVYDETGAVKVAAFVRIYNVTSGDSLMDVTNSNGQYIFDLDNMTSDYINGDILIISAYIAGYSVDYVTTVNTSNTGESNADLYLMEGDRLVELTPTGAKAQSQVSLLSYAVSNKDSSIQYLDLYEVYTGKLRFRIYAGVTITASNYFGSFGIPFRGGIAKVPSANNKIIPALVVL